MVGYTPTFSVLNHSQKYPYSLHFIYIYIIWLSAKICTCKGLCTSVENKTLLKTVFIWNVVLCTCTNEWIYSTYNFSNQAVVDFKIQSSHTEKALKNDHQKRTSMYEWFSSLCLQTNHKHMEKQSLICTRKTSFYMDNTTSTLMIVVFSINWSQMFALYYVRYVANSNWKLWTTEKWQHCFGITGNIKCVPIHAFALHSDTCFFQRSFAWNLNNIFPNRLILL